MSIFQENKTRSQLSTISQLLMGSGATVNLLPIDAAWTNYDNALERFRRNASAWGTNRLSVQIGRISAIQFAHEILFYYRRIYAGMPDAIKGVKEAKDFINTEFNKVQPRAGTLNESYTFESADALIRKLDGLHKQVISNATLLSQFFNGDVGKILIASEARVKELISKIPFASGAEQVRLVQELNGYLFSHYYSLPLQAEAVISEQVLKAYAPEVLNPPPPPPPPAVLAPPPPAVVAPPPPAVVAPPPAAPLPFVAPAPAIVEPVVVSAPAVLAPIVETPKLIVREGGDVQKVTTNEIVKGLSVPVFEKVAEIPAEVLETTTAPMLTKAINENVAQIVSQVSQPVPLPAAIAEQVIPQPARPKVVFSFLLLYG